MLEHVPMTLQGWTAYTVLVTILSFTPGPAVLLVLSQSLSRGMAMAFWAILGIVAVNFVYFALCGTGLSALLLASPKLFSALKWIGASYLIFIGAAEFFSGKIAPPAEPGDVGSKAAMFAKGFALQLSSPAALLFFAAVIPQFVNLNAPLTPQILLLAVTGNTAEIIMLGLYAVLADRFNARVIRGRFPRAIARISGSMLVAAGLAMAALNA
jgi:homoserine/homoserine lactone efflux protein